MATVYTETTIDQYWYHNIYMYMEVTLIWLQPLHMAGIAWPQLALGMRDSASLSGDTQILRKFILQDI